MLMLKRKNWNFRNWEKFFFFMDLIPGSLFLNESFDFNTEPLNENRL